MVIKHYKCSFYSGLKQSISITLSWERRLDFDGACSYGRSAMEAMILFLWPRGPIFNTFTRHNTVSQAVIQGKRYLN